MFDIELPGLDELAHVDDNALVTAISGWARVEAAAAARRLAAIGELVARRVSDDSACSRWACDGWDGAAAEVAAAQRLTHGKASSQMYLATALRNRLPRVAALFAEGALSTAVVAAIAWHTTLIEDLGALMLVDVALAADAGRYGQLSAAKTVAAIHAVIELHDPDALRRTRNAVRSRALVIEESDTESGTTPLWGRLYRHDAAMLDRRLTAMAHSVCDDDPRTVAQRRADALGALAAGADRLVCVCDNPDCPANTDGPHEPAGGALIYVLADATSIDTPADVHHNGEVSQCRPATPGTSLIEPPAREPDPSAVKTPPAQILGGPLIPASLLAELIRNGATVRPLSLPGANPSPEPHYRPSAKLADFIRARDLTCRFPNCDQPAQVCDIDHGIAYGAGGHTHPSNLRLLCRKHHLLKTFWSWHDRQHPDGTIDWTSPTGHTYTTYPGSRRLFPALCLPTGQLPTATPPTGQPHGDHTLMMPTRKCTRAQNRRRNIRTERARNRPPPP